MRLRSLRRLQDGHELSQTAFNKLMPLRDIPNQLAPLKSSFEERLVDDSNIKDDREEWSDIPRAHDNNGDTA